MSQSRFPEITTWSGMEPFHLLIFISFLVAVWNASVGPTGGIAFAAMAAILPPLAVIPIHAFVESAAGLSRTVAFRQFVNWAFATPFMVGGLAGCLVGMPILDADLLREDVLQILIGMMLLTITWIPFQRLAMGDRRSIGAVTGFGTTFLTFFVGATGPLVSALIHRGSADHRQVIGTWSLCMLFQHGLKVLVFGLLGFSFLLYLDLVIGLLIATLAGTWVGRKFLFNISPEFTKPVFNGVITLVALYLLADGLGITDGLRD